MRILNQRDMDTLTAAQVEALLQVVVNFLTREALNIGLTLIVIDGDGVKTVGNMPADSQVEAMRLVFERLRGMGPDSETEIDLPLPHAH